ncbi:MAG TPA: DEAD/DEAH box helicase [Desulfobacteraceae bacterium]|nr:DEAD/DEAH box helicase [Desulfobacteraceae bacterium]
MLGILLEEQYHPKDVSRCLGRIRKFDRLQEWERIEYALNEYRLAHYKRALSLLEKISLLPEKVLNNYGYSKRYITLFAEECRAQIGTPEKKAAPAGRRNYNARSKKKSIDRQVKDNGAVRIPVKDVVDRPARTDDRPSRTMKVDVPAIKISAFIHSPLNLHSRFISGESSNIRSYFLAHETARLSQAEHYDHLVCLSTLKDVEHFAYQIETVRKVMRRFRGRVLLADEVGLGKTIEACMVLKEYMMRGMVKKALILTPPALMSQWCEELSSKFGLSPTSTETAGLRQNPEHFWKTHNLIVASLAMARNKIHRPLLSRIGFDLIIVDEAHHVKNDKTAGWALINELKSRFLLLLSATPVENNLMDLFSLVTLLKPGQLGTRTSYRKQFVLRGDPTQPRNREKLRDLIGEVMIRNTRALADIKLPPRHASTVLVEGEPAEKELYTRLTDLVRKGFQYNMSRLSLGLLLQEAGSSPRAVRKTLLKMAAHSEVDGGIKEQITKLAKLCEYVPATSKTARLLELLQMSSEKVLVFSRFRATLEEIASRLSDTGIGFSVFQGNMSTEEKDRAVRKFQDGAEVMLCSEIGGEGRNLQFCSTMVNYDLPWNPMKIEQRIGRIHRIGQTRPVHIYNLCAAGTAEHHILEMLDKRINMFELVIGEIDLILGQENNETEFEERIVDIYAKSKSEKEIKTAFENLGDELLAARQRYDKIKQLDIDIFANDYEV